MKFKRFLRFDWSTYYPLGGFGDLSGDFDSLEEAKSEPPPVYGDAEIWDMEVGEQVWTSD